MPFAVKGIGNLASAGFRNANDAVNLFRAVKPAELDDLKNGGGIFRNPLGTERKYFSFTVEGASSYAQQTYKAGGGLYEGPYTIVGTRFPRSLIGPIDLANVDRGIDSVTVTTNNLQFLTRPRIFNFTPMPPRLPR